MALYEEHFNLYFRGCWCKNIYLYTVLVKPSQGVAHFMANMHGVRVLVHIL